MAILLLLLAVAILLLKIPAVQSKAACWAKNLLAKSIHTQVEIAELESALPSHIVLKQVVLYDQNGLPAFKADELRVNMLDLSLWDMIFDPEQDQHLSLDKVQLKNPHISLYKSARDKRLNIAFLFDKKKKDKKKQNGPLTLAFKHIEIENGRLQF